MEDNEAIRWATPLNKKELSLLIDSIMAHLGILYDMKAERVNGRDTYQTERRISIGNKIEDLEALRYHLANPSWDTQEERK